MGPCAFAIYVLLVDSIVEYTHFLDQNLQDLQNFLNWGCHLVGWFFIGGLPPFLSPHPLPLLHSLLIRDFKGHGEGEIGRLCHPNWVFCSRRRCRSRESGPRVGAQGWWGTSDFSLWRRLFGVAAKAGFVVLRRGGFLLADCKGSVSASLSAEGAAELPASPLAPPHRFSSFVSLWTSLGRGIRRRCRL